MIHFISFILLQVAIFTGENSSLAQQQKPNKGTPVTPQAYRQPASPKMGTPTGFQLSQENGQLTIGFVATDRNLFLSRKHPFSIQLYTRKPLEVSPSIVLDIDWPKEGLKMPLKLVGIQPNAENRIEGKTSYTYCNYTTRECKATKGRILYYAH